MHNNNDDDNDGVAQDGSHSAANREKKNTALLYGILL